MNHIEEAEKFFNSIKGGYRPNPEDESEVHALIAIAEQLRIANLIALAGSGAMSHVSAAKALEVVKYTSVGLPTGADLKPDIAETLGIKEES